ncbi:MAG: response regulator transcription factor [Planctomycetota bacterium]|nr:response regulator transcription factor [Planctomycetota bacterium]
MNPARILLVEDDESLGFALADALEREGYRPTWSRDGRDALERALARPWDLILLDLMLPGLDGHEICRRVRAAGHDVPILMLTARGREEDRVRGLDLGADDYVVKPFGLKELMARVRARLRARKPLAPEVVQLGPVRVDLGAMLIVRDGEEFPLTKLEAGVLTLFFANPGQVLTRGRFLDDVWGYHRHPTTRTVDMHVARVREKLGDAGPTPRWIHTVHGVGYRYDPGP